MTTTLPEPVIEEADVRKAAEVGIDHAFNTDMVALNAASRLHVCTTRDCCNLEVHNAWFVKLQKAARNFVLKLRAEGKVRVYERSKFYPGRGQAPTRYYLVEKDGK